MKLVKLIKLCLNETYRRVWIGKHISDIFPIRNGLKQGDAISPLLFSFALAYAIRRVQINQYGLTLNDTCQILSFVDDANILDEGVHTIQKNTEVVLVGSKDIVLAVNSDKTKYMVMS